MLVIAIFTISMYPIPFPLAWNGVIPTQDYYSCHPWQLLLPVLPPTPAPPPLLCPLVLLCSYCFFEYSFILALSLCRQIPYSSQSLCIPVLIIDGCQVVCLLVAMC